MAPIKFEENIKDKLEKRTLLPSSESWDKLSERLDKDNKKSKNPIFWWLSIAAAIIIMIALSAQFFGGNETNEVMPQVVKDEVEEQLKDNKEQKLNETKSIELVNEENDFEEKKEDSQIIKQPQIIDYKKVTQKKSKVETKLAVQNNLETKNSNFKQEDEINKEVNNLLDEAVMKNAVAKAKSEFNAENITVTDKEIDSLLKVASKELFNDKLLKNSSMTVDANALLMSVEEDMGQSFRSKVYEAIKESYKTVKTAVADRNN
ncbi:hypothetical protein H8K90_13875 [Winogradskyella echinorum]|uniref:Anti-sigma factor n=1 Tax=Winogradskyella echinorum TaxID=538189 RepID=A0ABR6Y3Z7_9FLAO|nr:hypothetical protein [Winogradskyella echinorum]MBC3847480.1 hypothetical protein [Winogradskyella echinorum]MBC5751828.1 hypothetical protein [Winogradskyella echinorum]